MVGLVDRVQAGLALGRVDLVGPVPGTVGRPTLPADPVPQLAHLVHLVHLVGSRVTANRVRQAQTPVNPQLLAPKLNSPG